MDSYGSSFRIGDLRIRLRDSNDDNYNNTYMCNRYLHPYTDENFRLDPTKYAKDENQTTDVDDDLLEKYVNRVLLSAAMKEAGEEGDYGVSKSENDRGSPSKRKPVYHERSSRQRKPDKKNKKNKKEERREEDIVYEEVPIYSNPPVEPTITLPVDEFRRMINAEIESRAARIHAYYQYQWDHAQDDRIEAYRSAIMWKENYQRTEFVYMNAEAELSKLKVAYDSLRKELASIKDAKRKRRNAAKTRRSNKDRNNNDNDENRYFGESEMNDS